MKKKLLLSVMVLTAAVVMAGCGAKETEVVEEAPVVEETTVEAEGETAEATSDMTLEEFFKENDLYSVYDEQIEQTKAQVSEMYSDVAWSVEGNTLTYEYTYAQEVEITDEIKQEITTTLENTVYGLLDGMAKECNIEDIAMRFVYNNVDGTKLYDETFTRK